MAENDREPNDETLDDLDSEVVEDLDADEDASDIEGGTSLGCRLR